MSKLPWTKYFFSIWIVAITAGMVAKYVTTSLLLLIPLSLVLYWMSVRSLAKIKGYE
ncbi:hypothetical protein ACFP1I_19900 [Dyadobacter subterraneus]|uniref:Uncharacterized protein n=1 Tax=Dyadobacter subterraneus TaxID=2773304 RepID=A0ABR9W6T9_9BACT|nr:hypothetical protein [Dyadobacter subterraneus]MBE9460884.1 hypothetical protein [Dyadobacter subterraneus]